MNFILLIPFFYFYATRLRKGVLVFHILFEWMAAALVVLLVGASRPIADLFHAVICYWAFISLYELGYIGNDLFSIRKELNGTRRVPPGTTRICIVSWVITRIGIFILCTEILGQWSSLAWWFYFIALVLVFTIHNVLEDSELRAITFSWLALFRFMAPVIFVVQDSQLMGICLSAAMSYVIFRQLGYMDSKGLLIMPGRQQPKFRLFIFLMPLIGVLALIPHYQAKGFCILSFYFSFVALLGTFIGKKWIAKKSAH